MKAKNKGNDLFFTSCECDQQLTNRIDEPWSKSTSSIDSTEFMKES